MRANTSAPQRRTARDDRPRHPEDQHEQRDRRPRPRPAPASRARRSTGRNGSSTPKPSRPGTGRMLRTNASTWISASAESADGEPDRHRHERDGRGQQRRRAPGSPRARPTRRGCAPRATGSRRGRSTPRRRAAGCRRAAGRTPAARSERPTFGVAADVEGEVALGAHGPVAAAVGRIARAPNSCRHSETAQPAEHEEHDPGREHRPGGRRLRRGTPPSTVTARRTRNHGLTRLDTSRTTPLC